MSDDELCSIWCLDRRNCACARVLEESRMSDPEKSAESIDVTSYEPQNWRKAFRWLLDSKENDVGQRFPNYTVASIEWAGSSVMISYHKYNGVLTVERWLRENTDNCLDLFLLDEEGRKRETWRLSWTHEQVSPFGLQRLDYTCADRVEYGVLLRNAMFEEVTEIGESEPAA